MQSKLGGDFLYGRVDGFKAAFDDFPCHFDIHTQIAVSKHVAHARDLFPWNGRVASG